MDFQQFLAAKNIDCQQLAPELLQALQQQFDQHLQRLAPVAEALVVNDNCPPKTHRLPVITDAAV